MSRTPGAKSKPMRCPKGHLFKYEGVHRQAHPECWDVTGAELIAKDKSPIDAAAIPIPAAVPFDSLTESAAPVSDKTLDEIETEINTADTVKNPTADAQTKPVATAPDKSIRVDAADVILVKDIFGVISEMLNEKFNTKDFPTEDYKLAKLERAFLATMQYYKVNFTPPLAFMMCVFFMYGLPLLKHTGILGKITGALEKVKDRAAGEKKSDGE